MSIANAIRDAALYHDDTLTSDELLNRMLSLFMQKGDWFNHWTHAITFALLVAEALDGGAHDVAVNDLLLRRDEQKKGGA